MNTIKLQRVIAFMVYAIGLTVIALAVYSIFAGVEPLSVFAVSGAGMVLGDAKGAKKVGKGLPFSVTEELTKGGKSAFALHFDNNEKGKNALLALKDILYFAFGNTGFAWPSKNKDREKFITHGIHFSQLEVAQNYQTLNAQTARELGEKAKAERTAIREAKKAEKAASKGTKVSPIQAKIEAFKDMLTQGIITPDKYVELVATLPNE